MDTCTYSDGGGQATVSRTRGMIGCRNNKEETRTSSVSQGTASADFLFFFSSHLLSSPFFSLPPVVVATQIRGHIAGSSPPSPLRFMPCIFVARRLQPFLPLSTRVELRVPSLLIGVLSSCYVVGRSFSIFGKKTKSYLAEIRTPRPTLTAFEGNRRHCISRACSSDGAAAEEYAVASAE